MYNIIYIELLYNAVDKKKQQRKSKEVFKVSSKIAFLWPVSVAFPVTCWKYFGTVFYFYEWDEI